MTTAKSNQIQYLCFIKRHTFGVSIKNHTYGVKLLIFLHDKDSNLKFVDLFILLGKVKQKCDFKIRLNMFTNFS